MGLRYCGCIFRKNNWHILPEFSPLTIGSSLAMIKNDVKNVLLNSLFFQNWPAIFFFFFLVICVICLERVYYCNKFDPFKCLVWRGLATSLLPIFSVSFLTSKHLLSRMSYYKWHCPWSMKHARPSFGQRDIRNRK